MVGTAVAPPWPADPVSFADGTCPRCGRQVDPVTLVCDGCRQVAGAPMGVVLGDPGRRLGQYLLDIALCLGTLGIGWFVWSLVTWKSGQTPAMRIMKLRVLHGATSRPARWLRMFVRELVVKMVVVGAVTAASFAAGVLLLDTMLLWDRGRRQVWDEIASTIVVDESGVPAHVLAEAWAPAATAAPVGPPVV